MNTLVQKRKREELTVYKLSEMVAIIKLNLYDSMSEFVTERINFKKE